MSNNCVSIVQLLVLPAAIALLFMPGLCSLQAQTMETYDRIELKNGGVLKGKITSLTTDTIVFQRLNGESEWEFPMSEVKRYITDFNADTDMDALRESRLPEMGRFYADLSIATLNAAEDHFDNKPGPYALNINMGYQFSPLFGMGLSAGRYKFPAYSSYKLYPIGVDFRGFLADHKLSPHYRLSAGYAITGVLVNRNKEENRLRPRGGFFVNPTLGLSWFFSNSAYISADIGAYFGRATYYSETFWWQGPQTEKDKITLKRWQGQIGFGFLFGNNKD